MYTEDNMRMDMPRPNNGTRKDRKENIDMSIVSKKSKQIPGSLIREMFAMQAGMKDVISFALGEPDFTAPQHVVDATVASFRRGETQYRHSCFAEGRGCDLSGAGAGLSAE